ncbi:MAG: hypothetical protein ACRELD_07815 [Longimicrobiales bacterium]
MSTDTAPPYELAFGEPAVEARIFDPIREEAEGRGIDARDPERFLLLGSVGAVLRMIVDVDATGGRTNVREAGMLLYQAHHFRAAGRPVLALDVDLARQLAAGVQDAAVEAPSPPDEAGYLRLPRHLFWARVAEDATPEPVDGVFWTRADLSLHLLAVLGLRAGRPGFSVIPIPAVALATLAERARSRARPDGDDFENVLPGGEIGGLFALLNADEVIKLVALAFAADRRRRAAGEP